MGLGTGNQHAPSRPAAEAPFSFLVCSLICGAQEGRLHPYNRLTVEACQYMSYLEAFYEHTSMLYPLVWLLSGMKLLYLELWLAPAFRFYIGFKWRRERRGII